MRTLMIIAVGVVLVVLLAWLCPASRRRLVAQVFMLVWLGLCAWNLSVGLSHGYSLSEELPIHAVLFGVPAVLAWWLLIRRAPSLP